MRMSWTLRWVIVGQRVHSYRHNSVGQRCVGPRMRRLHKALHVLAAHLCWNLIRGDLVVHLDRQVGRLRWAYWVHRWEQPRESWTGWVRVCGVRDIATLVHVGDVSRCWVGHSCVIWC